MDWITQLLGKIEDAEAREQFTGLTEKAPAIKDWIIDPEIRQKTEQISQWAETEWDYEHGMSKLEYRQQQELATLHSQLLTRDKTMKPDELTELNEHLGKFIKENGLMTKADFDAAVTAKEQAFNQELNTISRLATRVPYLNARYQKEFGEMFDPDEFVKQATEKGYARDGVDGLDKYYRDFTADKIEAKRQADVLAQVQKAKEDGIREGLQQRAAATGSGMPTLDGSPEMSHFEAKIRGMNKPIDPNAPTVPAEIELGRGVGKYAAAVADAKDFAGRVN